MNNITPKETYLKDTKRADRHMEVMLNPAFHQACSVALLQYVMNMDLLDPRTGPRIEGAKEVLKLLLNLGDATPPKQPDKFEGLKPI